MKINTGLKERLKIAYATKESSVRDGAINEICILLGEPKDNIIVDYAYPAENGIGVHLTVDDLSFHYRPDGTIQMTVDGELYDVKDRSDVARILTLKEYLKGQDDVDK